MKGRYSITVENKRLRYDFEIKRNITIIRGDSATGKTTLINMLLNYQRLGEASGVNVKASCPLVVAQEDDWQYRISSNPGSIVFVDECNHFIVTEDFAKTVKASDNYFVLILRDDLPNLPYSVEEIYGLRTSEKYAGLKKIYHELYNLYGSMDKECLCLGDKVITEDSNSGYEFFSQLYKDKKIDVVSANGKSNVAKILKSCNDEQVLVIGDGAAFGSEMEAVMRYVDNSNKIMLYLPESFEWILLNSGIIEDSDIAKILQRPEENIDSQQYFSWERYFTYLLSMKTKDTYLQYSKAHLNENYLKGNVFDRIKNTLPEKIK